MFLIASSGRCATAAVCHGLDTYGDYEVKHEPPPHLLHEALLKHHGLDYATPTMTAQLEFFRKQARKKYGQSVRTPNLLEDFAAVAPESRFLIIVREPLSYVVSAHARKVLQKGDVWDRTRIMPRHSPASAPLAERLTEHWLEVNRYLLDFASRRDVASRVVILHRLEQDVDDWAEFLGVKIRDRSKLRRFLLDNPNATTDQQQPDGFDAARLTEMSEETWERAQSLAGVN